MNDHSLLFYYSFQIKQNKNRKVTLKCTENEMEMRNIAQAALV
jgi:hypothetical protein